MNADVRYQVFLSSTYEDLRQERQQATQAILEMNHMPAGMELFPASDLSQWELIKTVINDSDYYIVVVAGRYGSIHKDTGLSFTEMEYDYAIQIGIPVLGFVRKHPEKISAGFSEVDPVAKGKLDKFRQKVMSRTCRPYEEPMELGMLVMKSLMNETRINPKTGWVRANQARGKEDIEREQSLLEEIATKDKLIKKLERQARDRMVPLSGISIDEISRGEDIYPIAITFQDGNKKLVHQNVNLTWDEIFSVIAPTMYGYIVRRGQPAHNQLVGAYPFEGALISHIRTKMISECGNRQINLLSHQIDDVLIQFKQLGLMELTEKTKDEDGRYFRGFQLTPAGEEHLMRIKVKLRVQN